MLVIVHDRDVEGGLDPVLDLEAPGCGDVLEVDRPERRRDPLDRLDDLVDVVGVDDDGNRVESGEAPEQRALASITGRDAVAPMSPSPRTAEPSEITATRRPVQVRVFARSGSSAITVQTRATPGV